MKRFSILVLALAFLFTFSFGVMADEHLLWTDNAGVDPMTEEGWLIDVGTLEGWSDSNFETLEYKTAGKSSVVGTGITVDGIKIDWTYPGSGFIGKGEDLVGDTRLDQTIDYTIVAYAEIPCVLKMNVFGNGAYAEGISIGDDSEVNINNGLYMAGEGEVAPGQNSHFMIFDPDYGGIVNADWEFMELSAIDYATGEAVGAYINACDLWTADIWANVPYGFSVSSTGLGNFAGLEDLLTIEMRYLERIGNGIVSQLSELPPYEEDIVSDNTEWAGDFMLDEDGVEIGTYDAGQNSHINMQFRVPVTGAPAGRYQGEVTFSTYTI